MTTFFAYIAIGLVILGLINIVVSTYNKLVMLNNNTDKTFKNIDILLKQRADEIPNLIKVVKEFQNHESDLLTKLTKLRTDFLQANTVKDKVEISNEMNKQLKTLFAVSENYPDLKSNENFLLLQNRVSQIEDAIADRRELYNESVNMYNIGIAEFPNVLLAKPMGYNKKEFFNITEQEIEYNGVTF
ncbi:LemA family protein [Pasteurella skyensis]|uniref:LemA family protein n=1 Tax=Phocoenobacter skyensis TaxID=97481 RepID=A0AAJ6P1S4_9PAST|nr:LemA family protein [Pasteurella skyensis]MDP8169800.1 LemA family protein [Pasteurella skyensis]MDP8173974.1 LemA family protein [Pasteurella skyensis]MDP8177409.1 LemA family protein [Pasteurella skyensis]MDP8200005.1 LemA family protein [Pasteurella skyensis]